MLARSEAAVATAGRLRVEAHIETNDANLNKTLFDELQAEPNKWQGLVGYELTWERVDDKRASRIPAIASSQTSRPRGTMAASGLGDRRGPSPV